MKILIVEDETFVKQAIASYLKTEGFNNISSATKGKEAIEKIEKDKPDFVLLDIQLADETDGMEVLKRAREISPDSKVIMMSAYYDEFGREAKRLGAYYFIRKPMRQETFDDLVVTLRK